MACVSVPELCRIVRFAATFGFLCEPRDDFVAHTNLSRHYLHKTVLSDAILFFGDTFLTTTFNTPLTAGLQGIAAYGSNTTSSSRGSAMSLRFRSHHHQPRLKRQANAFQRQILQQALTSESIATDLLETWMSDSSPVNYTVVHVCCDSPTVAQTIARRHAEFYFIIQLLANYKPASEETIDSSGLGHVTIQICTSTSPQSITDAWLYIVHLPIPSILDTPADILSQATHLLWTHFSILRQNTYSRVVVVAHGIVGSAKANSKADAAARMYDLLLMQMAADIHAITMEQIAHLVSNVRDTSWKLIICAKEVSDSHPIVAFEVALEAI
jgi:hypothetical protein